MLKACQVTQLHGHHTGYVCQLCRFELHIHTLCGLCLPPPKPLEVKQVFEEVGVGCPYITNYYHTAGTTCPK